MARVGILGACFLQGGGSAALARCVGARAPFYPMTGWEAAGAAEPPLGGNGL